MKISKPFFMAFENKYLHLISRNFFYLLFMFLGFIGPINLVDDPIPDVMIKVREKKDTPPPNSGIL